MPKLQLSFKLALTCLPRESCLRLCVSPVAAPGLQRGLPGEVHAEVPGLPEVL